MTCSGSLWKGGMLSAYRCPADANSISSIGPAKPKLHLHRPIDCSSVAAVTTISVITSGDAISHCTVARFGAASDTIQAYQISFLPAKSLVKFLNHICAARRRLLSVPASARHLSILASTCFVCPCISWLRSSAVMPLTLTGLL